MHHRCLRSILTLDAPPMQYWVMSWPAVFLTKSVIVSMPLTAAFVIGIRRSHSGSVGLSMKCLQIITHQILLSVDQDIRDYRTRLQVYAMMESSDLDFCKMSFLKTKLWFGTWSSRAVTLCYYWVALALWGTVWYQFSRNNIASVEIGHHFSYGHSQYNY